MSDYFVHAIVVLVVGVLGWRLVSHARVPAATVVGPMIFVGAVTALGLVQIESPGWFKLIMQFTVGTFLGYTMDRNAVLSIKRMVKPVALLTAWMIAAALVIGYIFARVTQVDLTTAFLATSPGGVAEMSAMAMSSQANVAMVATLQSFRIIATTLAIPFWVRGMAAQSPQKNSEPSANLLSPPTANRGHRWGWLIWLAIGLAGALVFGWLKIPAANVIGSMVFVSAVRVMGIGIERPPVALRTLAQVGLGILIGLTVTEQTVRLLVTSFPLVIAVTAATIISSLMLAGIVRRMLQIDLQTALLACAPAGVVQMGIIADEVGARVYIVNIFQLTRLIAAILLFPIVFHFFV